MNVGSTCPSRITEPYLTLTNDTESELVELTVFFNIPSSFLYCALKFSILVRNVTENLKKKF